MNKTVYLGLSILDLSKTVMHEFWYYYMKPKYGKNTNPCYMGKLFSMCKQMIFTKYCRRC